MSLSGYHAKWNPTEQSPRLPSEQPACPDVFCSLDQTAVGKTDRWILTSRLEARQWSAGAYAQYYDWHMVSDPTYDFQIDQFDRRWTVGGKAQRQFIDQGPVELMAGTELRYDDARVSASTTPKTACSSRTSATTPSARPRSPPTPKRAGM